MALQILILISGLILVILGANFLVEGASSIARRAGLSEFVIGLTIVGIGTSAPEMVVSFIGAIEGNSAISVGNIVGSNIFNILLILGVVAFINPIVINRDNQRRDIPINLFITVLLILLGFKHTIFGVGEDCLSRFDGALFLLLFALYLFISFRSASAEDTQSPAEKPPMKTVIAVLAVVLGLASLILGGKVFMGSAEKIARMIGVSDKFIAITVLAGGTSLPELATSVVAAMKKKDQMALGNIIGSTTSNVLLILGGSALIHPLSFAAMNKVDMGVFLVSSILLLTCSYTGKKKCLDKGEGAVFLLLFAGYIAWLIYTM
ncbi:MAG: calcium/sodium antiporter [Bacteroidales bacterium]|nr:calcium/sodium antiporter [Bacteroidales bacterium]